MFHLLSVVHFFQSGNNLKLNFPGRLQLVAAERAEREVRDSNPPVALAAATEARRTARLPPTRNQERTQGKSCQRWE